MNAHWFRRRQVRRLAWLLLVPALALRVMVPAGFMPGTSGDHGLTMQMCHGAGPLPAPAGPDGAGGEHAQEGPCVFAVAGTVAPPPFELVLSGGYSLVTVAVAAPDLPVFHRSPPRAHAARAPPDSPLPV